MGRTRYGRAAAASAPAAALPLAVFGDEWGRWIADAAEAAACPPDYVAVPLLASVSALIGHARWAQATPGWSEPPHLWMADVGDSGIGKSPGADCLLRDVLPEIERRMLADFPDRLRDGASLPSWRKPPRRHGRTRSAPRRSRARRRPSRRCRPGPEPQAPRLRQNDVTIERVATLLATAAPKGLLIVRDELAGWITGMNAYNDAGPGILDRGIRRPAIPGRAAEAPGADHRAAARGVGIRRRSAGSPRTADARGR